MPSGASLVKNTNISFPASQLGPHLGVQEEGGGIKKTRVQTLPRNKGVRLVQTFAGGGLYETFPASSQ